MVRVLTIALLLSMVACKPLKPLLCIDPLEGTKEAQFADMYELKTYVLKKKDARLGKIYYFNQSKLKQ